MDEKSKVVKISKMIINILERVVNGLKYFMSKIGTQNILNIIFIIALAILIILSSSGCAASQEYKSPCACDGWLQNA